MIPRPFIAKWRAHAPWRSNAQIEQDLIISRSLVAIFSDNFLSENLAFRGGTALHKLYIHPAPRYSEDIDLVQIKEGPVKPILQRIAERIDFFEEERVVKQRASNNTIVYRFTAEDSLQVRLRLKIEINCREHFTILGCNSIPYQVNNEWFSGQANITTCPLEELLGTKLRALYQRKKGRDLFDLYYADKHHRLDHDKIIHCYNAYMKFSVVRPPTQKEFILNLDQKQTSTEFSGDMEGLLRPEIVYDQDRAFQWIISKLICKLK
jgi:predicted nucleotidyltransferase component of viral defense system